MTSADEYLEIGELFFDETITKIGKDFYCEFFNRWNNPTEIRSFSFTVKEKPIPGLGTQLKVFINEEELFVRFLQPTQEQIEKDSKDAVEICQKYLLKYQDIHQQLNAEAQMGSEIF